MYKVKAVLTLSAAMLALCFARTAWAQVACNGSTPAPCVNPTASDGGGNTAGIIASGGSCSITSKYTHNPNDPAGQDCLATLNLTSDTALAIPLTGRQAVSLPPIPILGF